MQTEIETHRDGRPRAVSEIMLDVNQEFEKAVRRDPANWFWVHNRWKISGAGETKIAAAARSSSALSSPPPEARQNVTVE